MQRFLAAIALIALGVACGQAAEPLPVREVTVFKDGHALVLREGKVVVDGRGDANLENLPAPVLGTFWPYATQPGVTLSSVTAGESPRTTERDVASLKELLAANLGAMVTLREYSGSPNPRIFTGKLLSISPDGAMALLETPDGITHRRLDMLADITFSGNVKRRFTETSSQNRMTLHLSGAKGQAQVGLLYLQKGIRWIPSYKISIDGKGTASVQLQATLVNDLIDLDDATVNLVIGMPRFAFKDTPDPIGFQDAVARLSRYFDTDARTPGAFSNAIMTQQLGRMGEYRDSNAGAREPSGPTVVESGKAEDLFVFTLSHVTLKRGERMALPVTQFSLPYRDVYTLELLPTPPRNQYGAYESGPVAEMARLLGQPKVMHQLRLTNSSKFPLTTAPALLFSGNRLLAQSLTTYTPIGGKSDVAITAATDITIKRSDKESGRTANAFQSDGYQYFRVDLEGQVELCNYGDAPAEIEATRYVLGAVDKASHDGAAAALDPLLDDNLPDWLGQYNQYADRLRFTGLGKIHWKQTLPPGGKTCVTLTYAWHYFTR